MRRNDEKQKLMPSKNPKKASWFSPSYGSMPVWVHEKSKKPGWLVVGTRSGDELFEVLAKRVTYEFGESVKISYGDLKRLIRETVLQEDNSEKSEQENDDSLDLQVDRYLAQYEGEAKSSKNEGVDFRMMVRRIVSEAEGDDKDKEDDKEDEEPKKLSVDDIDVDSFANSVVRLINNHESLIEFRSTIARRALNFLAKSYDAEVVDLLEKALRDDHGIVPGKSKLDIDDEQFSPPAAARAGDSGGGAA